MDVSDVRIGIIGLGYVRLPLAVEFGKKFHTTGFDINQARIAELEKGVDNTLEVDAEELRSANKLGYTSNVEDLRECNFYVVTVPTPIDKNKRPDLSPLKSASQLVTGPPPHPGAPPLPLHRVARTAEGRMADLGPLVSLQRA